MFTKNLNKTVNDSFVLTFILIYVRFIAIYNNVLKMMVDVKANIVAIK